jgi:hypothetical protein
MGLQQTSPIGAGSTVGLTVMPAGSVALRDGHSPGERTPTRLVGANGLSGQSSCCARLGNLRASMVRVAGTGL